MTESRLGWFRESRFGMFIHWGLYALPARHEWVKSRERLDDRHYDRYFQHFYPDRFDPAAWAAAARQAGMRYMAVTTKHHEGFCLWDSALTDYKVTNTPWGQDLLHPLVDAFRAEGLRIGFYHSLIDWHHPEFPIDSLHPQRDDEAAKAAGSKRNMARYAEYLHGQVRELLTDFGTVDYLFFDFSYPGRPGGKGAAEWRSVELLKMVRELQPQAVVNDRLDIPGDFVTPEQYQPAGPMERDGQRVCWEACQTFNGSWGYDRDNQDWKTTDMLIRMLVDGVSKDGNLLLNVGPNARGMLEDRALERLAGIGRWMGLHERSIYGAGPSELTPPADCRFTQRGDRLYLHIFAWPFRHLHLNGLADRVAYAQFLHDGSEVKMRVADPHAQAQNTTMGGLAADTLTLELPVAQPPVDVPVVELFLRA